MKGNNLQAQFQPFNIFLILYLLHLIMLISYGYRYYLNSQDVNLNEFLHLQVYLGVMNVVYTVLPILGRFALFRHIAHISIGVNIGFLVFIFYFIPEDDFEMQYLMKEILITIVIPALKMNASFLLVLNFPWHKKSERLIMVNPESLLPAQKEIRAPEMILNSERVMMKAMV